MLFTLGVSVPVKFETLSSNSRLLNINSNPEIIILGEKRKGKKRRENVTSDANEVSSQPRRKKAGKSSFDDFPCNF